jgi:hypothetical protein
LVYAHVPTVTDAIEVDRRSFADSNTETIGKSRGVATDMIARGTEIVVVPEMLGCLFNPSRQSFLWLEDWHRVEFRLLASPEIKGYKEGQERMGRIMFFVETVLVGEVTVWMQFSSKDEDPVTVLPDGQATATPYQAVFVSYSHDDARVVEQLERAYTVLGIQYLRDVKVLRSGEKWNAALLSKIDEASIFQLFWSKNAKKSHYVEREWRHALSLRRDAFIRPVYWEQPMPDPPTELADVHFALLDLSKSEIERV